MYPLSSLPSPPVSPPLKRVLRQTLPLCVGLFAVMLVQLVDAVFISMLGINELTIHGITQPFQAIFVGLQVGIGVAATAIISRACGAQNQVKSQIVATLSVVGGIGFLAGVACLFWLLSQPIFLAFISADLPANNYRALALIFDSYWLYWLLSAVSVAALYLMTCVFRANQNAKTSGQMFLLASVINAVLDPIFIFSLDLGINGAAIASTIAYTTGVIYMLYKARNKQWFYAICINRQTSKYAKELCENVIPSTMNQSLPSLSAFLCLVFIAKMGTDAIAFWSLLSRLESFLLVFTLALTMAIPPMVGQSLGKGNFEDIAELVKHTAKFLVGFHLVIALLIAAISVHVAPLFGPNATIQSWFELVLWVMPFSYAPLGLCMLVVSVLNALTVPKLALLVSAVRLIALYVPAIWIASSTSSMIYVLLAAATANTLAGAYAWVKLKQLIGIEYTQSQLAQV